MKVRNEIPVSADVEEIAGLASADSDIPVAIDVVVFVASVAVASAIITLLA
jgi:hypothetical protein